MTRRAYIGLGSNLGQREAHLSAALEGLRRAPGVTLLRSSGLYETAPVGPPQPDYLNAVAELEVTLAPLQLLELLRALERAAGRERRERWGPRTLDLDLLFYGGDVLELPGLTVPHPELHRRRFVLEPLVELAPEFVHPVLGRTAFQLLQELTTESPAP